MQSLAMIHLVGRARNYAFILADENLADRWGLGDINSDLRSRGDSWTYSELIDVPCLGVDGV